MTSPVRVAVAITTFRRVELLPPLIKAVLAQISELDAGYVGRVVIVDNDPDESARSTVEGFGIFYAPESTPGIAAARQRVLDETATDDVAVMLDDDVLPEAGWLLEILKAWSRYRPTAVMGFVRWIWPDLDEPTIRKVQAGGFMRRPPLATGTRQNWLATGNVLLDMNEVGRLDVKFDVSLGLSGGEDTLFGREIVQRGGAIIACRESSVAAVIPPERATADFARRRAIGQGTSISFLRLRNEKGMKRFLLRGLALVSGALRFCIFTGARGAARLVGSEAAEGKYLRKLWFSIGRMRGAIGHTSDEYSRPKK